MSRDWSKTGEDPEARQVGRGQPLSLRPEGPVTPEELVEALDGVGFPASRPDLVDFARAGNARAPVIETLMNLPERRYRSLADVEREFAHREAAK